MKIGQLAQQTGTPVDTIRYYEREGLLPRAARTEGNYRIYDAVHLERLAFIRRCRSLDMTLDEIRVLLCFRDRPLESCEDVNTLLDAHMLPGRSTGGRLRNLERAVARGDGGRRALCIGESPFCNACRRPTARGPKNARTGGGLTDRPRAADSLKGL